MSSWDSLKLSPTTLRKFIGHLSFLKTKLDDEHKCSMFFSHFPFDHIFNFNTTDPPTIRLCVQILDFFTNYEEFSHHTSHLSRGLEFVLINLNIITKDCEEVLPLFQLLVKIIQLNPELTELTNLGCQEKILETMLKLSNFKSIQESKFLDYATILNILLNSGFEDSLNNLVSDLFEKFMEYNMVAEQLDICEYILQSNSKLSSLSFENVWQWLIKCPVMLTQILDRNLVEKVLKCVLSFIGNWSNPNNLDREQRLKFWKIIHELFNNLYKVTSSICLHMCEPHLNDTCKRLLQVIIMKFLNGENLSSEERDEISTAVEDLPNDVENWPKCDIDVFFCICCICVDNNNLLWKPKSVLNAIMHCFYNRRHHIRPFVLKSLYYLYPMLISFTNLTINFKTLGDDMLDYFVSVCSVPYLYSYNAGQLKWMLEGVPKCAKSIVLSRWVNALEENELLENALTSTISSCKAEIVLIQLIVKNNDFKNETVGLRAAKLLAKILNKDISSFITYILPFTIDNPVSLSNLIMTMLESSSDLSNSIMICTFMGAIISGITDILVLKGACMFSGKLLSSNKNNALAVKGFCRNIGNIQHLIHLTGKIDEATEVEIFRLLKLIIALQQRNKVKLEPPVSTDVKIFITGSSEKIKRSLCLLCNIISYRHSLISLDVTQIMELYDILLDYSLNPQFQSDICRCLKVLLKRMPDLTQTMSTSIYLEMVCLQNLDVTSKMNVFNILDVWFSLVRKEPFNGFCWIPENAIKSFISRSDISDYQKQRYFAALGDLLKRGKNRKRKNVFYLT